ncbi:MAG: HAD-IIIA family hydrolase [Lachnospiraceae bacterium]|jgi:putative hydrolase of the HAD superfamily|nr:HAD-IIIA family hydrolase [Lachnospiraceae bacterium]
MTTQVEQIFFDVGDTLRIVVEDDAHRANAYKRVTELLGVDADPFEFAEVLNERYEGYRKWATKAWVELPEAELWHQFLTPDIPREVTDKNAVELTYLFRQFKGYRVTADNAMEVVQELTKRGYHLGIISNVITSQELPDWLKDDGLEPYFSPVVLSSTTGIRKPDPRIYEIALKEANLTPDKCCYIGDNVERDMGGSHTVGFGMRILIDHKGVIKREFTELTKPDAIITGCMDLLDIFPGDGRINTESKWMYK